MLTRIVVLLLIAVGILDDNGVAVFQFVQSSDYGSSQIHPYAPPSGVSQDKINYGEPIKICNDTCSLEYLNFYLYTRKTQNRPVKIGFDCYKELQFYRNRCKTFLFLIHGFGGSHNDLFNRRTREDDYCIISVHWTEYASVPDYVTAAYNVAPVGVCIGKFIKTLLAGKSCDIVIIVGFSLGAHVAGSAGDYLKSYAACILSCIIGLDPAGPLFFGIDNNNFVLTYTLSEDDAINVLVIHTNALMFGTILKLGNCDVYFNAPSLGQPVCLYKPDVACSHYMSFIYFTIAILRRDKFLAHHCDWTGYPRTSGHKHFNDIVLIEPGISCGPCGIVCVHIF